MDIRIGIIHSPREIDVDMPEGTDRDQLLADVGRVLEDPAAVLWLTDKRGRRGCAGGADRLCRDRRGQ